jgi:hypothetical protein
MRETIMRDLGVLTAVAVAALGLTAAVAFAGDTKRMTVGLPGGGTAVIEYHGDVAPQVTFRETPLGAAARRPAASDPAFADFERDFADLQRQMAALRARIERDARVHGLHGINTDAEVAASGGMNSYSEVTTSVNGRTCTKTVRVTAGADGKRRVERRSSGDCRTSGGARPAPSRTHADDEDASDDAL